MMSNINSNKSSVFAPYYETDNTPFVMKIGGTTYEVSTHFNPKGRQCLLEQFKELILSEHLI